jgi:hypothetical protein
MNSIIEIYKNATAVSFTVYDTLEKIHLEDRHIRLNGVIIDAINHFSYDLEKVILSKNLYLNCDYEFKKITNKINYKKFLNKNYIYLNIGPGKIFTSEKSTIEIGDIFYVKNPNLNLYIKSYTYLMRVKLVKNN